MPERTRMARLDGSGRVLLAAFAGNLAVAATKFAAFGFTGATALLTEGVHTLVDAGNQVLLFVGRRRAVRPASRGHPFGYGLEAYFWSFVVAVMVFLAGGAVSIWEGVRHIRAPAETSHPWVSFAVLAASAVFEGLSFRVAYREFRRLVGDSGTRLIPFLRLSKDPSLFGSLLEDGAALVGLAIAAFGVAGASLLGLRWADGAASVGIGVLLLGVAFFMANETRSLIAGEAAAPVIEARLRTAATEAAPPLTVRRLSTLQLGPVAILVVVEIATPQDVSLADWGASAARIRAACAEADRRVCGVVFRPAAEDAGGSPDDVSDKGDAPEPTRD